MTQKVKTPIKNSCCRCVCFCSVERRLNNSLFSSCFSIFVLLWSQVPINQRVKRRCINTWPLICFWDLSFLCIDKTGPTRKLQYGLFWVYFFVPPSVSLNHVTYRCPWLCFCVVFVLSFDHLQNAKNLHHWHFVPSLWVKTPSMFSILSSNVQLFDGDTYPKHDAQVSCVGRTETHQSSQR